MSKLRVVLDTNAFLVSISRKSKFRPIFDCLLSGKIQLVISNEILMEYVEIIEEKANATVANNIAELLINRKNVEKIEVSYKWNCLDFDFFDLGIALP